MTNSITRRTAIAIGAAAAMLGASGAASAADFAGETVEIIVPAGEGGGTDLWARFLAPLIQRHLPGTPSVIIRNMPGGGHTTGGNFFASNAEPDGLMLLASSGTGHFNYLLGDGRVNYEFRDMRTVAAGAAGGVMYVRSDVGISGPDDFAALKEAELKYGSQGPTSQDLLSFYALEQLGIVAQPIFGMRGRSDARLAVERGDLNIDYQTSFSYEQNVRPMAESGEVIPLFTFGALNNEGELVRDPGFPDLPHFGEVYETVNGEPLSGTPEEVYMAFFTAGFGSQKLLSLPASTPDDIIAAYDAAMAAAVEDPEFEARRNDLIGPYPQFIGEEAERMKTIATNVSDEARDAVAVWLKERFEVDIE